MKIKKRKKATRFRGTHTHGRGGKKKARGSGHRGGVGMAGSGKRGDQRKTLILNLPEKYFGKDKALRRKIKFRPKTINLQNIEDNINSFVKKGIAKESKGLYELSLEEYKILGEGIVKNKMKIKAHSASESAINKVKNSGGEIIVKKESS